MRRTPAILLASLLFTYFFFFEYIPPFRHVHIPYDLDSYHFSLADYTFQSLRHGRLPVWDPTIYCGMSMVANLQAAIFYPPTWVLYAASLGHKHLPFQGLADLQMAHVWLAFVLGYFWLRGRRLHHLAAALGAGVFAFSGYMCTQLQHFGMVATYTWIPLGLWGIDQARDRNSWKPLWKVALASALGFLAGYPPTWVVLVVSMVVYAIAGSSRWKITAGVIVSLAASLALAMVQLLPAWEASKLLAPDPRYGFGIRDPAFFLSYLLPNYFNFGMNVPAGTNPGYDYFWLGTPALIGLILLVRRKNVRDILPAAAVGAVILVLATNSFGLPAAVITRSNLLSAIFRDWYLLAGITPAVAALAAYGLDDFLRRPGRAVPTWLPWIGFAAVGVWICYELSRWSGRGFAHGWRSLEYVFISAAVLSVALFAFRSQRGRLRTAMGVAILLSAGVDYKVFGTSKRFDAGFGGGPNYFDDSLWAMDSDALAELRANSTYRVLLDSTGPFPAEFRHLGLTTPQGFDPFLSEQLRKVVEAQGKFLTDRQFEIDPENESAMRLFGIRYVIMNAGSPFYARLEASPKFEMVKSKDSYYKTFEYLDARPPFGWESANADDRIELRGWHSDARQFTVRSMQGGTLTLSEQFYPGWSAIIDGRSFMPERWQGAFQSVSVPAGEHTVEFRFRSRYLALGAWISVLSLLGLALWIATDWGQPNRPANP